MRLARLQAEITAYPNDDLLMPTQTGNLLRAAEAYPQMRYGLDLFNVWPRLWLALPKSIQDELAAARKALDEQTQLLIWGVLFSAWSGLTWWALLPSLVIAVVGVRGMYQAAGVYAQLIRAAFDLYRFELYRQAAWPCRQKPCDEEVEGRKLDEFLRRGFSDDSILFKHSEKSKS